MKRKVLAILMAAAMTMTVMAGCGGAAPSEQRIRGPSRRPEPMRRPVKRQGRRKKPPLRLQWCSIP